MVANNKPKRISRQARIWTVLRLKTAGASDRDIARTLGEDPTNPVKVSHQQINKDWHEALNTLVASEREQAERLQSLQGMRLERLLMAHWPAATNPQDPNVEAGNLCSRIIHEIRQLYGLDRELGDEDRPINVQERTPIDYSKLGTDEIKFLIRIIQRQQGIIEG